MKTYRETLLATIPAKAPTERLTVVLCQPLGGGSYLELRQQSWGDGVGWFNQNSIQVDSSQIPSLRAALGGCTQGLPVPRNTDVRHVPPFLRVVHADSA